MLTYAQPGTQLENIRSKPLTAWQPFFQEHGYLYFRSFMPKALCERVSNFFEGNMEGLRRYSKRPDMKQGPVYMGPTPDTDEIPVLLQQYIGMRESAFGDIGIVQLLLSLTNAVPIQGLSTYFQHNSGFGVHKENTTQEPGDNPLLVTWFALQDIPADGEGLVLMPGTHHIGVAEFEATYGPITIGQPADTRARMERHHLIEASYAHYFSKHHVEALTPAFEQGDLVIMHGDLIHAGTQIVDHDLEACVRRSFSTRWHMFSP